MPGSSHSLQSGSQSIWVIDQIGNGVASIEVDGKTMMTMPLSVLPKGTQEGDVLRATIVADPAEQARRLVASAAQLSKGRTGGKGNITL
jgi:hypothetical protein